MNDERGEKLVRAWAESTPAFDRDRGRDRFLAAHRRSRAPGPRSRAWMLVAAALLVAGASAAFAVFWPRPVTFAAASARGEVGAWLATASTAELPLSFSEGTRVVLEADSRGRVDRLDRSGARFLLERGAFHADVTHRSGADWRFVAGPFEVVVTGTKLAASWNPAKEEFSLSVTEGAVIVRGPVGAEQVVRAGERYAVDVASKSMHLTSERPAGSGEAPLPAPVAPSASSSENETPPSPPVPGRAALPAPLAPSWSALLERGDYDGAFVAAERAGLSGLYASASSDELLRLSQVGRLSGHREVEREALLACRRRFPDSSQAALAAYELGRASSPAEAATWFEAYYREQPGGSLAREALGRLMEAHALAGNGAAARDAAKRYLARYPEGPHAPFARRQIAREKDG